LFEGRAFFVCYKLLAGLTYRPVISLDRPRRTMSYTEIAFPALRLSHRLVRIERRIG